MNIVKCKIKIKLGLSLMSSPRFIDLALSLFYLESGCFYVLKIFLKLIFFLN
jgi:hypothetical protein